MPDSVAESQQTAGDPAAKIAAAFQATNSSKNGLSSAEAQRRLAQYGRNALEDRTESKWHKLLSYFR
jgi:H+-transporting ATPase